MTLLKIDGTHSDTLFHGGEGHWSTEKTEENEKLSHLQFNFEWIR